MFEWRTDIPFHSDLYVFAFVFSSPQRISRECSGCSDGVKRSCGCGRCYCCSRAALDDFMQQRMSAWEPLLTPRRILFVLFGVGLIFVVLGFVILLVNNSIVECKVNYTDMDGDVSLKVTQN